jgi:hypothetical protein
MEGHSGKIKLPILVNTRFKTIVFLSNLTVADKQLDVIQFLPTNLHKNLRFISGSNKNQDHYSKSSAKLFYKKQLN